MPRATTQRAGGSVPLVSILIPCYNAEPWIRQCIQSALDQTWPNKEIIVIDDGSTDAGVAIIESFGDRIRFQVSPHSGGNAIRNRLTQLAGGEWLQYLDADDYLLPEKIASQMAHLESSGADVDIVYSPVIAYEDGQAPSAGGCEITDSDETLTLIRWGPLNTGGLLLKRRAVLETGGWKEDQKCCQEHELLLRAWLAGCRFLLHNSAEAVYRQHGSDTVSRRNPLLTIRLRMELTDRLAGHLESSGKLTAAHREALFVARMECARSAYRLDSQLAEELCRKAEANGRSWVLGCPALPVVYQLALRLAGFENTERLAAWFRGNHAGSGIA